MQVDALLEAGCLEKDIYKEKASGAKSDREQLAHCLNALEPGDTLVVWKLDRLGRSLQHLVSIVTDLNERNIGFKSIQDGMIDTSSPSGELIFNIFASLSQFERALIRERTKSGLMAARARGKKGGRRPITPDDPKVKAARLMHADPSHSVKEICSTLNISRATFYRYIQQ
jgi:DNA invertase Pin-like site-specific DNA recombinase